MAISAKISTSSTVVGSVSQGNQPQVTRITVPGPKGDSGATGGKLVELADVDSTTVADGALIQYDGTSEKFVITNEIETETGTIRLNGGVF